MRDDASTQTPTLTLDQLHASLVPGDPEVLAAESPPEAQAGFQELGAKVASSRIIVDVERLYGLAYAFWHTATDDQKDTLAGFSDLLLAVAVEQAVRLRDAVSDQDDAGHVDTAARSRVETEAQVAFARGIQLRDQAAVVLTGVAGPDEALKGEVSAAKGRADDFDALAKGIGRLEALGRRFLGDARPAVKGRIKSKRLTAAYLDRLAAAGTEVERTGRAARVRLTAKKLSQAEVDTLDGLNLHLLSDIIHAFEAAHTLDHQVPRLVPISVRRFLAGAVKRKPSTDATPEPATS
ncbi:MAG: hypothetical protein U1F43_22300 [Myxococcota bacterium]